MATWSVRRRLLPILLLWGTSLCAQQSAPKAAEPAAAKPTKSDIRKADSSFKRALRLQSQPENSDNLTHALEALEESKELNPLDATYATTYEFVKQQLISSHLEKGDRLMQHNLLADAIAEYREVLALDPNHAIGQERLRTAMVGAAPQRAQALLTATDYASEPILAPKAGKVPFDYRGDSRQLMSTVGKAFGIQVLFDDSTPSRTVRFQLDAADFATAMRAARQVTGTFYLPMSPTEIIVAADNVDARRRLEHLSLRTYQLSNVSSAQELTDIATLLRTMLDIRFVITDQAASTLSVRAPTETLRAVDLLIEDVSSARPEVMLEIHAYQISRSMNRNMGVNLPLQFTIFNVGTEARALLNNFNNQDLISRLIATGAVTAADAAAIAAALAAQGGSPFLQPFAVFGGGKTLSGLIIPNVGLKLDYSNTTVSVIQHMTLRASQGSPAIYRVGDRIPVLTSQYAPLINIPGVTPSAAASGIIPSFNYEELGITLKTTPRVNGNNDVTLQVELQIKALGGQRFNNVPTISTREYTGMMTLKDGEASVIAGSINTQETNSISGLPWFSRIPLLGMAVSVHGKQDNTSELLFVITPHVLRQPRPRQDATETVIGSN
ncbi:MAG TPA: type II and III secretion system protein [Terriglobales bacterium]|nr:type II and III secretion system protein [Terriglobales bacterium]